jgi:hypothetical protein
MELHRDCFTYKQHWKFWICSQIATYILVLITYCMVVYLQTSDHLKLPLGRPRIWENNIKMCPYL